MPHGLTDVCQTRAEVPKAGHPGSHTALVLLTGIAAVPCAKLDLHGILGLGSVSEMAGCGSSISCDSSLEQRMAGLDVRAPFVFAPVPGPQHQGTGCSGPGQGLQLYWESAAAHTFPHPGMSCGGGPEPVLAPAPPAGMPTWGCSWALPGPSSSPSRVSAPAQQRVQRSPQGHRCCSHSLWLRGPRYRRRPRSG